MILMTMTLIDSHTHIDFPVFDGDRARLLEEFSYLGGRALIIAGVEQRHWQRQIDLCERYPQCYYALGLHPMFSHLPANQCIPSLKEAITEASPIAVGEFGLDKYSKVSLEEQRRLVDAQLELANHFELPVILHCRGYHNELIQSLLRNTPKAGGVIHAFSGSYELAMSFIKLGIRIGVGGVISYQRAAKTRRAIAKLPLDQLLLETDSPDMPLEGEQGKANTPSRTYTVLECLAALKGLDKERVAEQIYINTRSVFKLTI